MPCLGAGGQGPKCRPVSRWMLAMLSSLSFPPWTKARSHQEAETMASSREGGSRQCVQGSRREWGSGQLYHRRFAGTRCSGDELETPVRAQAGGPSEVVD